MEHYSIEGKNYIADDGYVFRSKATGMISKKLRLCFGVTMDSYEVIEEPVEPIVEETPEDEEVEVEL